MKKGIIVLLIALLGVSFTVTSALAGSLHGHGYKGTSITVAGCGPAGFFRVHSAFSGPPVFFPFPPPFFHGTVVKNRDRYCNGNHRAFSHKDYRQHRGNNRRWDNRGNGEKNRSNGHRKRL